MALYLRGDIWWFEYRTRKVRIQKSTGFHKAYRKKAEEVYFAFRLAMGSNQKRSVVESMLNAIYDEGKKDSFPVGSIYLVYQEWVEGKKKRVSHKTEGDRRRVFGHFAEWAESRGITQAWDVTAPVAREYVSTMKDKANKTVRNTCQTLSTIWEAVKQIREGVFNPWKAATPDIDGTAEIRQAFSPEQVESILVACKEEGHDWYGMSLLSLDTGLRYVDCAFLDWDSVDLDVGVIHLTQHKTKKPVVIPLTERLALFLKDRKNHEGLVFPEHALHYKKKRSNFSRVLLMAGVKGSYTFHSWRHTFRTRLASAGVSDETARRLGGWSSIAMSAHYDHDPHLAEMRTAIKAIENG